MGRHETRFTSVDLLDIARNLLGAGCTQCMHGCLTARPRMPRSNRGSVFLASQDFSYMTGQVLHPNSGEIVNT
jgi:hypothetical protein